MYWVNIENKRIFPAIFFIFPMIFLFSCATPQDLFQKIEAGQTKQIILNILGEPDNIENFKKSSGPIFGPEEEFWDKIPEDTELEVWKYQNNSGGLNLYFVNGRDVLSYKAFSPTGVVY